MPEWIRKPGPVLLRNFTRTSKKDPKVLDVELLDSNPHYAWMQHQDGRQQTISTRHLARKPRNNLMFKEPEASDDDYDYYVENSQHSLPVDSKNRFQELDANENPILVEDTLKTNDVIDFKSTESIKKEPPDQF